MEMRVSVREIGREDRVALWEWRQDPITRALFPCDPAITYERHRRWFDCAMTAGDVVWCVGLVETLRIGCVRFDQMNPTEYHVSLFLKPPYCGKGYGRVFLQAAIEFLKARRPIRKLVAQVKNANPASGTLFQEAGFSIANEGHHLRCELMCDVPSSAMHGVTVASGEA